MTLTASPLTASSGRTHADLTDDEIDSLGRELDALRDEVLASRGASDAAYIRRVITVQRSLELGSRVVLLAGRWKPAWWVGTTGLTLAKTLDNMEIGHNVLHGQWDWMRDPKIHSTAWQWDHVSPPELWQRAHNQTHHRFTNIVGQDNDLGYGMMRVAEEQPWRPWHLSQPVLNGLMACVFEWSIAMYDADLGAAFDKKVENDDARDRLRATMRRGGRQLAKDFVVHPLLSGRGWKRTLSANAVSLLVRNLWSHSVIMCGHFPEGVDVFEVDELPETESKGQWYIRQGLGSANVSGSPLMHLMTGNLSHQIEHHLFPDLPSNRYRHISPRVQELFERHGLRYHAAPLPQQVASAWHRVLRLSFPNGWLEQTNRHNLRGQLRELRTAVRRSSQKATETVD